MFLRSHKRWKNGKPHRYFSIVENRRIAGRGTQGGHIAQRTVLYLGEINDSQQASWRKTLDVFDGTGERPKALALFPDDRPIPPDALNALQVRNASDAHDRHNSRVLGLVSPSPWASATPGHSHLARAPAIDKSSLLPDLCRPVVAGGVGVPPTNNGYVVLLARCDRRDTHVPRAWVAEGLFWLRQSPSGLHVRPGVASACAPRPEPRRFFRTLAIGGTSRSIDEPARVGQFKLETDAPSPERSRSKHRRRSRAQSRSPPSRG